MPGRTIQLSTGEEVIFKERFNHKADLVNTEARDAARRPDGTIPSSGSKKALDATLAYMIESIEKEKGTLPFSQDWLDALPVEEYEKLSAELVRLINESVTKIEAGKKNP